MHPNLPDAVYYFISIMMSKIELQEKNNCQTKGNAKNYDFFLTNLNR